MVFASTPHAWQAGRRVLRRRPEVALGHRRNHAKGICFTGVFEAKRGRFCALEGCGFFARGAVSGARALQPGNRKSETRRIRPSGCVAWEYGFSPPDGQEWRSAMINAPVFPVSTPETFYELLRAEGSKEPKRDSDFRRGPSGVRSVQRVGQERALDRQLRGKSGSTASTASSSSTVPAQSTWCAGRCTRRRNRSLSRPMSSPSVAPISSNRRLPSASPARHKRWTMVVTVANAGDPTADPSKAWPADRRHHRGRHASRRSKSRPSRTAHAAISISIPPCCHPACARRMIRFLPRGLGRLRKVVRSAHGRRPRTIPERRQEPRHDRGSATLHPVAAVCCTGSWQPASWPCSLIGVGMVSTVMPKYLTLVFNP